MIQKSSIKNGQIKSRNLSREKRPARAQIFRYFRIESRNKKLALYMMELKKTLLIILKLLKLF